MANTREAVYMESVLHNVSLSPPDVFAVASLRHFHLVKLQRPASPDFVSFHTPYPPKLKLTRAQLIDRMTDCYPETRAWSQAAYLERAGVLAIGYGSGCCLMLFK